MKSPSTRSFLFAMHLAAIGMLLASAASFAQTQLHGPRTATSLQGGVAPVPSSVLTRPSSLAQPSQATQATQATQAIVLTRFQTVMIDNKLVDLRSLPDATLLRGKSGRTISVARIKQLQARIDGTSNAPIVIAQRGQSLKSLSAAPAGTLVALPGGRITRSQDLAKIQTVIAKLGQKRVIKPIPVAQKNAAATAVVGNGISLADAMKRPGADVIQIGVHKYSADQLRQMDALLKDSRVEPRGLLERAGRKLPRQGGSK